MVQIHLGPFVKNGSLHYASVAKLGHATDLRSVAARHEGSIPSRSTFVLRWLDNHRSSNLLSCDAQVAKLDYALVSKTSGSNTIPVRFRS